MFDITEELIKQICKFNKNINCQCLCTIRIFYLVSIYTNLIDISNISNFKKDLNEFAVYCS